MVNILRYRTVHSPFQFMTTDDIVYLQCKCSHHYSLLYMKKRKVLYKIARVAMLRITPFAHIQLKLESENWYKSNKVTSE